MNNKNLNLPNTLSSLRILLIPVIFLLIVNSTESNYPYLLALYFSALLLDFLDGYIARKFSMETELGKILDPLADKLLILFILVALIIKTDFPFWLALIIFLRDFCILLASILIFKGKHRIKPSILVGKITFGILSVLTFIYIIDLHKSFDLIIMKKFFISLCFTFLLWSCFSYYNIYKEEKQKKAKDIT